MVSICFYFQVHQPFRLRRYSIFEIGNNHNYFDDQKNEEVMKKVAKKCYLPTNKLILDLIKHMDGKFKASYSITGTAIEQFERYAPEVLDSFKQLVKTGKVELLSETYYHSLSYLYSKEEFKEQIMKHKRLMKKHFGVTPKVFRNTELIFNNEIAKFIEDMGYKGILAEGADHILGWKSPNFLYTPVTCKKIKLLLKNYKLSDDVAFRFSNRGWSEWPLTVPKFVRWLNRANGCGNVINLFMDYETFGEHQWEDTGIFDFMRHLPYEFLKHPDNDFVTPSEAINRYESQDYMDIHNIISWADLERDLSAWLGNKMQQSALHELFQIEKHVKVTNDKKLIEDWRKLTTSDHFYYMCTKYFNPYDTPYEGLITFMNSLNDIMDRTKDHTSKTNANIGRAIT